MDGAKFSGPLAMIAGSSGNYLSSTLFIATLFHGVVIMGVTFTSPDAPVAIEEATSLEVVLITGDYEKLRRPEDARLLADRNLTGTGNTNEDTPVRVAYGRNPNPQMPGPEQLGNSDTTEQGSNSRSMTLIVDAHTEDSTSALPEEQNRKALEKIAQRGMPGSENPVEIVAEPDRETVLTSATPRELVISASTRESRIASYLDSWKRKVERVGTLHYPHDLRQQNLKGYPTLEVAIAADGSLEEVIVLASSGHRKLDRAAVEILYLAAPFEPFPESLTNEYEVLRFAYEWQFTGETTVRASVGLSGES